MMMIIFNDHLGDDKNFYDDDYFENDDNDGGDGDLLADDFMDWSSPRPFPYQIRYTGRCYDIYVVEKVVRFPTTKWLAFQLVVGFPNSGWKSTHGG